MNKKILLFLLTIVTLFTITGCGNSNDNSNKESEDNGNTIESNYKTYECRYSKDDNAEGKRYLIKYIFELNDKNEIEVYTLINGFSNYGSETDGYKEFCNGLKDNKQTDLLEKYKDAVAMKVVCDENNNYEAYTVKEYQVKKIKDINDFSAIYKFLEPYIKNDGTFDLEKFKNYLNTDSLKAGNYTCNY
jgi:hypothetical protein